MISDYETIEKPFGNEKGNPRYIYFIGKSNYIEKWVEKSEKSREKITRILSSLKLITEIHGIIEMKMAIITMKIGNYIHSPLPLSLYWFVEDVNNKTSKFLISNIQKDNSQDEVKMLQDIISLLQN